MAHYALTLLLPLLFLGGAAHAAPEQALNRKQALQSLAHAEAQVRREAASRLGEVGMMEDTPALLQALRDADGGTRAYAEQAMWQIWGRSGDRQVDELYRSGVEQMSNGELQQGIATFTRVIGLKPGFAEGWNKRATLYFLSGEYRKSLDDCAQVIKLNPYHFGALAGYGQIYLRLEDYARSLEYFRRALELNPTMDSVRLNILLLEQLIEQRRSEMI
ncbi:MAG: tetratricopeptide repeat protein [Burkholderiales bacterium]|nr:tetratricopeptide repeat protein [Burkholderiales bacterium]